MSDHKVIATADDAILSKLHASSMGYYQDPFLSHFAKDAEGLTSSSRLSCSMPTSSRHPDDSLRNRPRHEMASHHPSNRHIHHGQKNVGGQPLMRRGSFARVCCIDRAISTFLSLSPAVDEANVKRQTHLKPSTTRQVIILGAGKDSTYLRYQAGLLTTPPDLSMNSSTPNVVKWYEVDFATVIDAKRQILQSLPSNLSTFSGGSDDNCQNEFYLVAHDLRSPTQDLFRTLTQQHNFDVNVPTLFVLECVLMYLTGKFSPIFCCLCSWIQCVPEIPTILHGICCISSLILITAYSIPLTS